LRKELFLLEAANLRVYLLWQKDNTGFTPVCEKLSVLNANGLPTAIRILT